MVRSCSGGPATAVTTPSNEPWARRHDHLCVEGESRDRAQHRRRLGLEPKRKDWRPAAMARLPKQAAKLLAKGRELIKEAKGLK